MSATKAVACGSSSHSLSSERNETVEVKSDEQAVGKIQR